jgi:hypothetical protein
MATPQAALVRSRAKQRSGKPLRQPAAAESNGTRTGEKEQSVPASFRFKRELHEKLRRYCFIASISQNEFVNAAIEQKLQKDITNVGSERDREFVLGV